MKWLAILSSFPLLKSLYSGKMTAPPGGEISKMLMGELGSKGWVWVPRAILSAPLLLLPHPSQTTRISHSRPFFSPRQTLRFWDSEIAALIAASNSPTSGERGPWVIMGLVAKHVSTFCEARGAEAVYITAVYSTAVLKHAILAKDTSTWAAVIPASSEQNAMDSMQLTSCQHLRQLKEGIGGPECLPGPLCLVIQVPPLPPRQESWCSSCPWLALVSLLCFPALCVVHWLSIYLQCGTAHSPEQRPCPLPLPPFPAQGVCSVNNSSFCVLWSAHVPGTGLAALCHLPQSSQEVVLSLANAWHGVAFRKLSLNKWTYGRMQIRNWI